MTVVGILGCTALILSGFGLKDSIVNIPNVQYKVVNKFDTMIYLNKSVHEYQINDLFDYENIDIFVKTHMATASIDNYNINIFVPNDDNNLREIISLNDVNNKKKINMKDNEVIVSDKLAQLVNVKKGDSVSIVDNEKKSHNFIISNISENYVGHYVFMNKKTYESSINKYNTNVVYFKIKDLKHENKLISSLLNNEKVMNATSIKTTINSVNNMLKSLNSVVLILIILSAVLSFVVLYNLSYINISERKREVATLKVLGFTDNEVDNYIIKETIILTIIGIVLGLLFGTFLTNIIINTVEIEAVRFIHHINIFSYIYSAIITIIFTIVVNIITHFSLKKIDMVESLKGVE